MRWVGSPAAVNGGTHCTGRWLFACRLYVVGATTHKAAVLVLIQLPLALMFSLTDFGDIAYNHTGLHKSKVGEDMGTDLSVKSMCEYPCHLARTTRTCLSVRHGGEVCSEVQT